MSKSLPISIKSGKFSKEDNDTAGLEKIRQAGICRHYEQLRGQGLSPNECLEKTAEFARISERQAKGKLTGNIQPTGKKTSTYSKYLEEIEKAEFELPKTGSNKKRRSYPEIRNAIENDPKLNKEENRSLKSEIDRRIKEAEKRTHTHSSLIEEPQFNSLAEALNSLDTKDETTKKPQPKTLEDAIKKFDPCK